MSGGVASVKVAVTGVTAVSLTTQVPVPEQPEPLQPTKADPPAGVADHFPKPRWRG